MIYLINNCLAGNYGAVFKDFSVSQRLEINFHYYPEIYRN